MKLLNLLAYFFGPAVGLYAALLRYAVLMSQRIKSDDEVALFISRCKNVVNYSHVYLFVQ